MQKNLIEAKANSILRKHKLPIPVSVQDLIDNLGIKISYASSEKYSGLLLIQEDKKILMGINSSESFVRQRFTMAHELGHYFLEHKKSAFVDNKVMINFRENGHTDGSNPIEKDANFFAACLLMPRKNVDEDFKALTQKNKIFLDSHLAQLASKYEVSKEAMKYRLMHLKLISL